MNIIDCIEDPVECLEEILGVVVDDYNAWFIKHYGNWELRPNNRPNAKDYQLAMALHVQRGQMLTARKHTQIWGTKPIVDEMSRLIWEYDRKIAAEQKARR